MFLNLFFSVSLRIHSNYWTEQAYPISSAPWFTLVVCQLVRSHLSSSTVPKKYVQKVNEHAGTDTFFIPCLYFHALKSEAQVTCQVWEMTYSNKQQAAKQIMHSPPQNKILLRYVDNSASCLPDMLDMMSFSQCSSRLPFSFHFSLWCYLNILMWAGELLGFQSVLCCQQCSLFFWADTVLPRYVVKSIWKISNAADSRFCPVYCLLYFSLTNIVFVYYIFSTLKHDLSSQATRQSTLSSKHTAVL